LIRSQSTVGDGRLRRRSGRALVAVALVGALLSLMIVAGGPAGAVTASRVSTASTPPAEFCTAFGEYYDAAFLVQFITAFAQSLKPKAAAKTRTSILLVLAPKLQKLLGEMATTGATPLRAPFSKQAKQFARGTQILRAAGLSDAQIQTLADTPLHTTSATDDLLGNTPITKKKLNAAVDKFGKVGASVDPTKTLTSAQRNRLGIDGVSCGVFPDPTVACTSIVSADDVVAAAGADATPQTTQGCWWKGADAPDGNPSGLGVDVDRGTLAYDRIVGEGQGATPVAGVGDAATMLNGFQSFADFSSCGHTLVTKAGDRTVTVALCPASGEATPDRLAALARAVLARL
jgi:hypothetical protein